MKKLILCIAFALAGSLAYSQNSLTVKMKAQDLHLGKITANYADGTSEDLEVGDKSNYQFDIGKAKLVSVTISGVTVKDGVETAVIVNNHNLKAILRSINDGKKSVLSIIK